MVEGPARVWFFIGGLALVTASLWAFNLGHFPPLPPAGEFSLSWWELAIGFYLAEVFVLHLHFRKQAHTLSLAEVVLVPALFLASPAALLIGQTVGASVALAFNRRQRPVKFAFNLAELPLCSGIALLVFRSLNDGTISSTRSWAIAILATAVAHAVGMGLVSAVICVAEGKLVAPQLSQTLGISLVGAFATTCLGLAAVALIEQRPAAGLLLIVPVVACGLAFRGYMEQREQREHVEFLYESMRATQGAPEFGLAVGQLLVAARRLLRAEYAEILLASPTPGGPLLRSVSGPSGELLMHPEESPDPSDELALREVAQSAHPILLSRRRSAHPLDQFLATRHVADALVGALRGENGALGALIVGERAGDVSTFTEDDVNLYETFAGHASILLENGRLGHSLAQVTELKEQLKHQAYHDSLTGLPNRLYFVESVEERLAANANDSQTAVLYLDLDRFKLVNDSWGHQAGDELLVQVAERIRRSVRSSDVPARLGGDEFAVLVDVQDIEIAERIAQGLTEALSGTFSLKRGEATVHASIGIALHGPDASTAEELIRNADIAMYSAKRVDRQRYALYEPTLHGRVRHKQRLGLDLELAIGRGEIVVHYQPIVSLADGDIKGFEALARWQHPERGLLLPAEFLPAAEDNGLMVELGANVMEQALQCCSTWHSTPRPEEDIGIWINLSPTEFANERLVEDLSVALKRAGVDADRLTVELTESSVIGDEMKALTAMHRLRDLGVHLSIDDFGTGYSSLSRLAEFPIETLKIPEPFVNKLVGEDPDDTFVDAILRLAESLGLQTVAEGIEQVAQVGKLRELGCSLCQGFLFSKPIAAPEVLRLLGNPAGFETVVSAANVVRLAG